MCEPIISGGAKGADTLGERYAIDNNIECVIHYPDWGQYGKSAGYIRNGLIIADADIVLSLWDGMSKGTKHSMDIATKEGKSLIVYNFLEKKFV